MLNHIEDNGTKKYRTILLLLHCYFSNDYEKGINNKNINIIKEILVIKLFLISTFICFGLTRLLYFL